MSSSENIKMQIKDIESKMKRLELQKHLLLDRLKRKENHSQRIKQQNVNDAEAKKQHLSSISENPQIEDSRTFS